MSRKIKKSFNTTEKTINQISELRTYYNTSFDSTFERIVEFAFKNMNSKITIDENEDTKILIRELLLEVNLLKAKLNSQAENSVSHSKNITQLNERLNRHREEINRSRKNIDEQKLEIEAINSKGFFGFGKK